MSCRIAFGATYDITSFALQGDNNDYYALDFRVGSSGAWATLGVFTPGGSAGMLTRGPIFGAPFTASQVRLRGEDGDAYYSISEFQAMTATPEPGSVALLATGLAGLAAATWRRRRASRA